MDRLLSLAAARPADIDHLSGGRMRYLFAVLMLMVAGCSKPGYFVEGRVIDSWQEHHPGYMQMIPHSDGKTTSYTYLWHPPRTDYWVTVVRAETLTVDVRDPDKYVGARQSGKLWTWRGKPR